MPPLLAAIVASAALGALVGLVRQWRDQVEQPARWDLGGVRTYTFWAMLGCVGAYAGERTSPAILVVLAALIGAQQILAKVNAPQGARPGGTTFAASLLTFLVGGLVYWEEPAAAALVAALTMVLVGSKPTVHGWTRALTREDMRAVLQFAAITGVILPLAPNESFGPFRAFNPYSTWLMVVLISGVGFAGYAGMRLFGARTGVLLTSLFGGIASSTASTLAFARRSREEDKGPADFALAVVIACTVMLPRVMVIVAVVDAPFALALTAPLALMAVPGAVFVAWRLLRWRSRERDEHGPRLTNPLGLGTALKFGALYVVVNFAVKAAPALGWANSLLPVSFVSGFTGTDAILLSLAHSFATDDTLRAIAIRAAVLAVVANTMLKATVVAVIGSPALRRPVLLVLGATAACGVAWLFFPFGFGRP